MALGNTYNNNEEKDIYRPTVYGYSMGNTQSEIDKTNLAASMWKGTMKLSISPKIDNGKEDKVEWDTKNAAVIYLNHTKARIMAMIMRGFLKDPDTYNGQGVSSGQGLLTISTGEEFGYKNPCFVIKRISEKGEIESSYAYAFKQNYHCSIMNFDEKTGEFEQDFESYNTLEIQQYITQFEEYYRAMTGCVAFSVIDNMSWSNNRLDQSLAKIASGVGVELYSQKASKGNSYFANGGNKGNNTNKPASTSTTIDDIMNSDDE